MERSEVIQRLAVVRARIHAATVASHREADSVALLAVSKFHPAEAVRATHLAGQRMFGENRVQELVQKAGEVRDLDGLQWHMIGSLQTNKVGELLDVHGLAMLHSLDRQKLADVLQKELAARGRSLAVLIQVHATGEATKHGCLPTEVDGLVDHVRARCPNLQLRGLMAMGPLEGDPAPVFARVAAMLRDLRQRTGLALDVLSMGMSGDLEVAVEHGATMVRIGTDVFGAREEGV